MSEVAVVVCTYSRARLQLLQETLASLKCQQGVEPEVIVVVDGSPELEAELRSDPFFSWVKVIPNTGPRGLSAARNSGIAANQAELVAFIDDDAVADPYWLQRQVEAFENPAVMVTGGAVLPKLAAHRPEWWPSEFDWVIGCSYPGQIDDRHFPQDRDPAGAQAEPVPVRNVIGASMVFRRSALDAVGAFALGLGRVDKIPLGGEETEICIRVGKRFGPDSVVLVPASVVHHYVPAERLRVGYFFRRCYAEGLSKAVLSRLVRSTKSVSSEARYLVRTLPRAGIRHAGALFRGDAAGVARAATLLAGTGVTGFGWLRGQLSRAAPQARIVSAPGSH